MFREVQCSTNHRGEYLGYIRAASKKIMGRYLAKLARRLALKVEPINRDMEIFLAATAGGGFLSMNVPWLAGPTLGRREWGSLGPFTGWYIGDETSRNFPTKGQLDEGEELLKIVKIHRLQIKSDSSAFFSWCLFGEHKPKLVANSATGGFYQDHSVECPAESVVTLLYRKMKHQWTNRIDLHIFSCSRSGCPIDASTPIVKRMKAHTENNWMIICRHGSGQIIMTNPPHCHLKWWWKVREVSPKRPNNSG